MKSWNPILMLALFLAVTFAAAGLGAFFTGTSVRNWYPTLRKPSWNPPVWIFGPVWTALYLMMAIAAWLVWRKRGVYRQHKSPFSKMPVHPLARRDSDLKRQFDKAVQKAGLEGVTFHPLRYATASLLVMQGVDLTTVRDILRHKSIEKTLRYSHPAPAHRKAAVAALEQAPKTKEIKRGKKNLRLLDYPQIIPNDNPDGRDWI